MKKIKLTKKVYAIVDDEDFEYIDQWKWLCDSSGYAARSEFVAVVNGKQKNKWISMHRLINKTPDGFVTDHINGNRLDNRKCNLRSATVSQNCMNVKKNRGITYDKRRKTWKVTIGGKSNPNRYLGSFKRKEDAIKARNKAVKEKFGKFAHLWKE